MLFIEEQGWSSGEKALLPPLWPGVKCGLSLLLVVALPQEFLLGTPLFLPPENQQGEQ